MIRRSRLLVGLIQACHPGPCVVVTALACALAAAAGRGVAGTAAVGAAVLAGQLSVGWGNDLLDADRDRAAGREDKPVVRGDVSERTLRLAALLALAAAVPLSLLSSPSATAVHLLGIGLGWAYNLGLKRTVLSPLPYAGAFALLPVFVAAGAVGAAPWWLVLAAGLVGAGAHFTNVLPDLDRDARTGVRGLPQRAGHGPSVVAAAALLAGGALTVTVGRGGTGGTLGTVALAVALTLAAGTALVGWRQATRLAFRLAMATAVAALVLLLASGPALA